MLCCAVLCCAVLCCAVLCCAESVVVDVSCCLCCREEEADWLDFVVYTRRKNLTNPWSLHFLYEIKKR